MRLSPSTQTCSPQANHLPAIEQRLGPIEYRPVEAVRSYGRNLRKHPESQIVTIMASISEFGFALPLLVDESSEIVVGEARLEAAKRLKLREVPVIVAAHWSRAQVKAYRLIDNKYASLSSWNKDELVLELLEIIEVDETPIDLLGWETAEIDVLLEAGPSGGAEEASNDPADAQIRPPKVPVSRPGDIWLLGKHRLICGSSLDGSVWERLMDGKIAVMAFEDPPYNVPVSGHVCGLGKIQHAEFAMASGEMSRDEYIAFLISHIKVMITALGNGALVYVCIDWRHVDELISALETCGLTLINLCVWNKSNGGMGSLYRSKHELVWVAKFGDAPHINNVQLGRHGRYRTNVWDYPGVNSFGANRMAELKVHPTVKPVALVADAIRDVTRTGDIVVDGFVGSGTMILAAERTKRIAYGIEIEPGYVDVAIQRWQAMTKLRATLAETGQTFDEVASERLEGDSLVIGEA